MRNNRKKSNKTRKTKALTSNPNHEVPNSKIRETEREREGNSNPNHATSDKTRNTKALTTKIIKHKHLG